MPFIKNPLSKINPKSVGYGKSGYGSYKKDDKYSYTKGTEDVIKNVTNPYKRTQATANLTKENLEIIMGVMGDIVGNKDRHSELNRYDEMNFRHRLEQEFQKGNLSRADIKDAWDIWKNFDK